ncbi:hypothetical protein GCM10009676_30240 [Prauserella halophila]|uniref:Uncharacterized protein n=1 Tax=Prauserella halophila TaxID=185641 RepID=A0ABP4H0Z8_9PSEU
MQRLADQLVRDVGSVELGGVDVIDTELDGAAQHGDGLVVVTRWPQDAGTGQLHRTEPDAVHGNLAEGVRIHGRDASGARDASQTVLSRW